MVPVLKRCFVLPFEKKREIIEEVEAGWTITHLAQACKVPSNTRYNLRKIEREDHARPVGLW